MRIELKEPLHHAYCVLGESKEIVKGLISEFRRIGISVEANPDFRVEEFGVFGIDEAISLKDSSSRASVSKGKKIFVVTAKKLTRESQNALLKIFEEPKANTHFFLVISSDEMLLPTFRSRMMVLKPYREYGTDAKKNAIEFLSGNMSDRFAVISSLVKSTEDDGKSERIFQFLDALEMMLVEKGYKEKNISAIRALFLAKRFSRDRAPSFKILLDNLALSL